MRSARLRRRVGLAALVGLAAAVALPWNLPLSIRGALSWNAGGLVYLLLALATMRACGADAIEARAARQDDSRALILGIILLAIASSFSAIVGLLAEAKAATQGARLLFVGMAAMTISVSWLVTQVVFALHYAHEYYRPEAGDQPAAPGEADASEVTARGLEFPGCATPDYWDFLYFSTSIGATSQTSDVSIRSRALRRLVTLHAIVSFVFNTMILALTVNLAASMAT